MDLLDEVDWADALSKVSYIPSKQWKPETTDTRSMYYNPVMDEDMLICMPSQEEIDRLWDAL